MTFDAEKFKAGLVERLKRQYGKDIAHANSHDLYDAVAACTREMITSNWMATRAEYEKKPVKQLYYFSAEFLMGRALSNNIINLSYDPSTALCTITGTCFSPFSSI